MTDKAPFKPRRRHAHTENPSTTLQVVEPAGDQTQATTTGREPVNDYRFAINILVIWDVLLSVLLVTHIT